MKNSSLTNNIIFSILFSIIIITTLSGCNDSMSISPKNDINSINGPTSPAKTNGLNKLPIQRLSAQASSELWPSDKAVDGNLGTCWSSNVHGSPSYTEWIAYYIYGGENINYAKIWPRYYNGTAISFPKAFTIYWSDGEQWIQSYNYTNFPTPQHDGWLYFPLLNTSNGTVYGIKIVATQLDHDDFTNYVFQLSEVDAGYDEKYNHFVFLGNDGSLQNQNEIRNVGSDTFNPNKISNWNYDCRNPIITARSGSNRNIYAPNIVYNGHWNIYFGGWDGTNETPTHDRISMVTTNDFLTFPSSHNLIVDNGSYTDVNNPSVVRINPTQWIMYYTTAPNGNNNANKPAYTTSTDGVNWNPCIANADHLISMTGYNDWATADINGCNVVIYQNGQYYLYFNNFNNSEGIQYATSVDGINYTFCATSNGGLIVNDVKAFIYNGNNYYLMVSHRNCRDVYYSFNNNGLISFGAYNTLFSSSNSTLTISSVGLIQNNNRLYGALYGESNLEAQKNQAISAIWLQKKVLFANNYVTFGIGEQSYGPDRIRLSMNTQIETGNFKVYDCDRTTLLYTSPLITMRSGDIWEYRP